MDTKKHYQALSLVRKSGAETCWSESIMDSIRRSVGPSESIHNNAGAVSVLCGEIVYRTQWLAIVFCPQLERASLVIIYIAYNNVRGSAFFSMHLCRIGAKL